ncbi:MAG: hypothetical protein V5A87_03470 [Candidatus Bipolaricaulota bacterium]|nr:hypothetical protein [Candidatus Bipolaricaulota bacterium]MBS3792023.1 hypothetical protein [Candidatus Bipolaricaulota bacterium]
MKQSNSEFKFTGVAEEATEEEIVLIAGGKIGPIKDWITSVLKNGTNKNIRLFFGANTQNDLNGYRNLKDLSELSNNFSMVTALNTSNPEWEGEVGLITDVVRDKLHPDKVSKCYIYGTDVMIEETKRTLTGLGIPEEKIQHETFNRTR